MDAQQTSDATPPQIWVCELGLVPYGEALALQQQVSERRRAGQLPDTLLLLEHPPTYTRGRRAGADELPLGQDVYRARGIDVFETDRGGRVTYHGPGQLVGYPIMRVRDVGAFLRQMERAIVAALAREGIAARTRCEEGPDYTGVWVAERKIASIGVHLSRGVSTHGFAVNVDNDLAPFEWITACGLPGVRMTSLAAEAPAGARIDPVRFRNRMAQEFCAEHDRQTRLVDAAELPLPRSRGRRPRAHARRQPTSCADAPLQTALDGRPVLVTAGERLS